MSEEHCPCGQPGVRYTGDDVLVCQACYDAIPTPTPARSEAAGREEPIADVLEMLENVVDFAYEHGYHEHGVPLVGLVRERLVSLRQQLAAAREDGERLATAANALLDMLDGWAWTNHRINRSPNVKATVALDDMHELRDALRDAARSEPSGEVER